MPEVKVAELSVTQLNAYVAERIKEDVLLQNVAVVGEISGYKRYSSGHHYFTLKDDGAQVSATLFKWFATYLQFVPQEGMQVIAQGNVALYEKGGQYQFLVRSMRPAGQGKLDAALQELKQRLQQEGLFDLERKRPLPQYPKRVAVVTSPSGAVLHDILQISLRRNPSIEILFCPVSVQGDSAVSDIVHALYQLQQRQDIDAIIVGRGGGSAEDLSPFNDEALVRAVAASTLPLVSAVGHETDTTLCDWAADVRAPTPSAAAEMVFGLRSQWQSEVKDLADAATNILIQRIENAKRQVAMAGSLLHARHPRSRLDMAAMRLDHASEQMKLKIDRRVQTAWNRFHLLDSRLQANSPLAPLSRGFALLQDEKGAAVRSVKQLAIGQLVKAHLQDGQAALTVEKVVDENA